jgi:hypothetical protein
VATRVSGIESIGEDRVVHRAHLNRTDIAVDAVGFAQVARWSRSKVRQISSLPASSSALPGSGS